MFSARFRWMAPKIARLNVASSCFDRSVPQGVANCVVPWLVTRRQHFCFTVFTRHLSCSFVKSRQFSRIFYAKNCKWLDKSPWVQLNVSGFRGYDGCLGTIFVTFSWTKLFIDHRNANALIFFKFVSSTM